MKKIILILAVIVFFCGFKLASADVIINEIMYAPDSGSSYEWLEIYNPDAGSVDLTDWRFFNTESSSAPLRTSGSFILDSHSYALITGSSSSVSFSGQIFTSSSFSLPDNSLKYNTYKGVYSDSNKTKGDSVTYDTNIGGSKDSGNSLQLINGEWKASSPTPGAVNQDSGDEGGGDVGEEGDEEDSNLASDEDSDSDSESETKVTATPTLKTKILAKTLAFVGQPVEFSLDVKYGSLTYTTGKYFWNFGDGDSREVINESGKFSHTYFYPGEYAVSSEYYRSYLSNVPDEVKKITVKVVPLTVSISKVGDAKDFFIELTNNSNYEIDISKWMINTNGKIFVFPKNTVILSKKQMTVSGKITGFVLGDEKNLKLISSAGDVVFDYNPLPAPAEIVAETPAPAPVKISTAEPARNASQSDAGGVEDNNIEKVKTPEVEIPDQVQISPTQILPDILPATAVQSDIDIKENSNIYLFLSGLAGSLILSGGFVYFIRRNRVPANHEEGSDFKILDE
jgi:hypothetical protein